MQAELLQKAADLQCKTRQILYIDDEPSITAIVEYSLDLFTQWQVTTVSGGQALQVAEAKSWDVILLEIGLCSDIGFMLYDQLIHGPRTRHIPLMVFTTMVTAADLHTYQQMDLAGVIAKPFNPLTLGSQIAELLGWEDPAQTNRFRGCLKGQRASQIILGE
jgi:CheY-like chemotaxis protein